MTEEILVPIIYNNMVCYCEKREFVKESEEAIEAKEKIEKLKKQNIKIIEVNDENQNNNDPYFEFACEIVKLHQKQNNKANVYSYKNKMNIN